MKTGLTLLLIAIAFSLAAADDAERSFTYDFGTTGPRQTLPSWMTGQPVASPAAHATISFSIAPPTGDSDLAVTVYFTETPGGFLRVYWAGKQSSAMLSDNLYEGIGMPNQRTLLIKRSTLSSAGTVNIQSSEPSLNISRIHWEWVEPGTVSLAAAAKETAFVNAAGAALADSEVNGAPVLPKPDHVGDSVVTAALTEKAERIEGGVEFVATLQQTPQYARLEVQVAGVPTGKPVKLWINNTQAGEVPLAVPDLTDPGYQAAATGAPPSYIGWRKGAVYLPAALLKPGENHFQFSVQDAAADKPVAIKDLVLQLKYDGKAEAPAAATPASSPSPTPAPESSPAPEPSLFPAPDTPPPAETTGTPGG